MPIAYLKSEIGVDVNAVLADLAARLLADGLKVVGTTQTNTARVDTHKCDMDVRVLPDGDIIRISQNLGPNSRGCQLDPDALEHAVAATLSRLEGADILIVNKFGKHEADGRGFREVIAAAIEQGITVLVGTNGLNLQAFLDFTGGAASQLPADLDQLGDWVHARRKAA
ncbi:MAG: DUF2478 domain-containing protein [Pelagimonas sp.]|uniref:DUF2478 domain-containing protein n=1 Tax=Pelagimonas sp. TaxID=2073170 RepID=UPI003D6A7C4C